eukprot:CAMPEP_0116849494 /NCGR_PEP_ID=MMETSP0418-20121206/15607_1 /TAXON_ID=1158023 /ORGANISM="Astrosyne radiata, Strain 13vi08-1A" /LENGTH=229 /DNA_ID=CAMNT_0004481229 /DNA_START=63 /DNA_END=752 /DNA_ORIENTATION=-
MAVDAKVAQYAPEAARLFGNMMVPSSILAGAMVPLGFLAPISLQSDEKEGQLAKILRLAYPILAVTSLCSDLLAVMWATVAVNQLTETKVAMAESVWHLLSRDYALQWAAVNSHFVLGMLGFMGAVATRTYFMCNKGPFGASVSGIVVAGLTLMISVVNRGVASGGGSDMRYGTNFLALFSNYARLLVNRAFSTKTFGPLEITAISLMLVSITSAVRQIVINVNKTKKQ